MTSSPMRGPTARAVGLATAIVAVAALVLGLMAGALGDEAPAIGATPAAGATHPLSSALATAGSGADDPAPAGPAPTSPTRVPLGAASVPGRYVVVDGDTLASIADRSGVPMELIALDSGLTDPDRLSVGQVLTVSTPPRNVVVVAPGATLGEYARQLSTTVGNLVTLNPQIRDPDVVLAGSGLRVGTS